MAVFLNSKNSTDMGSDQSRDNNQVKKPLSNVMNEFNTKSPKCWLQVVNVIIFNSK